MRLLYFEIGFEGIHFPQILRRKKITKLIKSKAGNAVRQLSGL
jgi:hypothetical protein